MSGINFESFEKAQTRVNIPEDKKEIIEEFWNRDEVAFTNFIIGLLL